MTIQAIVTSRQGYDASSFVLHLDAGSLELIQTAIEVSATFYNAVDRSGEPTSGLPDWANNAGEVAEKLEKLLRDMIQATGMNATNGVIVPLPEGATSVDIAPPALILN